MSAVEKAVRIIGGQTATAKQFGIGQSHVWKWLNVFKQAPAKYVKKLSALTNNEVTVEELLADHENNLKNKDERE
ncbi:YdaS family helix-turn-helix protein [Shewanella algae]|uniref:YdaS family helix-turn-helix protein n=1 Tax=Shewanella algae TaxID=38313 RepID=UPI001C570E64|nr:YdaS family helix-turn-helix protein [Shewanella algae]HDS1200778.1 helix-turn-helix domain-containing protein [Shewanella algae]HEW9976040.1 helix-turn-helix domain-containing protein [Shewanella algae]